MVRAIDYMTDWLYRHDVWHSHSGFFFYLRCFLLGVFTCVVVGLMDGWLHFLAVILALSFLDAQPIVTFHVNAARDGTVCIE